MKLQVIILGITLFLAGTANARMVEHILECDSGNYGAPGSLSLRYDFPPEESSHLDARSVAHTRKDGKIVNYDVTNIEAVDKETDFESTDTCTPEGAHVSESKWKQKLRVFARDPKTGKKTTFTSVFKCVQGMVVDPRISDCPKEERVEDKD